MGDWALGWLCDCGDFHKDRSADGVFACQCRNEDLIELVAIQRFDELKAENAKLKKVVEAAKVILDCCCCVCGRVEDVGMALKSLDEGGGNV